MYFGFWSEVPFLKSPFNILCVVQWGSDRLLAAVLAFLYMGYDSNRLRQKSFFLQRLQHHCAKSMLSPKFASKSCPKDYSMSQGLQHVMTGIVFSPLNPSTSVKTLIILNKTLLSFKTQIMPSYLSHTLYLTYVSLPQRGTSLQMCK